MIYVLTEWNGRGSGSKILTTANKSEAMSDRLHTLTRRGAEKKYGLNYFYCDDLPCSTIESYPSLKAVSEGRPVTRRNWY